MTEIVNILLKNVYENIACFFHLIYSLIQQETLATSDD